MGPGRLDGSGVVVACASCGRANRLAYAALGKTTRCGQCRTAIDPPSTPIEVSDSATFDAATRASALPVIIDFWAPWCGPCRTVAPEIEKLARRNAGRYLVLKVNTDAVTDVASRFRIRSIPTLALVVSGRELDRLAGARPAEDIEAFAAQTVASAARHAS